MWAKDYISANRAGVTILDGSDDSDDVDADTDDEDSSHADDKHRWQMPCIDNIETGHPICSYLRTRAYRYAWAQCEQRIQGALTRIYEKTVVQLALFSRDPSLRESNLLIRGVPTGLITGCGAISSTALLPAIQNSIAGHEGSRPLIASLASWQCPNHKSACRSAIQAFIKAPKLTTNKRQSLVASDDFQTLIAWHRSQNDKNDMAPTLILYLEDFEAFDPRVLADLLYTISAHRQDLPLALLVPLATTVDSLIDALPRSASDLLQVKIFEVAHSSEAFQALMTATFSTAPPLPINLGNTVKSQLFRSFEDNDLSLEAVISSIKYIYLSRFFSDPTMIFAVELTDLCPQRMHDDLTAALLAQAHFLRALPSYRRHIQNNLVAAVSSGPRLKATHHLLSSELALVAAVRAARIEYEQRLRGFDAARQIAGLLERTYQTENNANKLSKQDDKLSATANILARNIRFSDASKVSDLLDAISAAHLAESCGVDIYAERMQDLLNSVTEMSARKLVNGNILGAKAARRADGDFTQLVIDLSEHLESYFDRTFGAPTDILFHELWYCDNEALLSQTFHPQIASNIGAALMDPSSRLPFGLLANAQAVDDLQNGEHDTVQAHRLVLDAGKFVNLADWHGAILSAQVNQAAAIGEPQTPIKNGRSRSRSMSSAPVSPSMSDSESAGANGKAMSPVSKQEIDLAKFMQVVSDLAYLGHLQPTKRKAEHIARIVL